MDFSKNGLMDRKRPVLLALVILLGLKIHNFECDDQVVRDVKPIIGEIFDMLLESIEAKRKKEAYLDDRQYESDRLEVASQERPKEPRTVMRGRVENDSLLDKIEIVEREISIQDGEMSLKLGIIANSAYGSRSVLVLKQWSEDYSEIGGDYGLLCSSSNINGVFITLLSRFKEDTQNVGRNSLLFEMKQRVEQLEGRTFLLCLSNSITSNRSVYITKLSFSSSKGREESHEGRQREEQDFGAKDELLGHYEFSEMDKDGYDQILVRTRAPEGQKCSDFVLGLTKSHGDQPISRGVLLYEANAPRSESLCFWSLKLENSLFRESNLLGIVQRHKNGRSSLNISTVRFLPLSYSSPSRAGARTSFSRSLLFKALFLALSLIPVLLLTLGAYAILTEIWAATSSRLLEAKKHLSSPTPESRGCEQRGISRERFREKDASSCVHGKEKIQTRLSNFGVISSKSLNSEESGLSSGENNHHVVKDDPFRYFDSDCSISTRTGI